MLPVKNIQNGLKENCQHLRIWDGHPLEDDEFVLSAEEKTTIQSRRHTTYSAQPGSPMKEEQEYTRCGAWAYIAALDVHRAKRFGRCECRSGIASLDRLVDDVMSQAPYAKARHVFWIVDNGSSHCQTIGMEIYPA